MLKTSEVLSIRGCDLISSDNDNDVTMCVFTCYEEENKNISTHGVQGYALRLKSLQDLGADYGICDIIGWNAVLCHLCVYSLLHYSNFDSFVRSKILGQQINALSRDFDTTALLTM